MISDNAAPGSESPHPLGAIPFDSAQELRAKSATKISNTLAQIEAAAIHELDEHQEKALSLRRILESVEIEPSLFGRIEQLCLKGKVPDWQVPSWFRELPGSIVAAAYYRICAEALSGQRTGVFRLACPGSVSASAWIATRGVQIAQSDLQYELLGSRLLNIQALNACLVLLQKHTGWNVNSVLEMTWDGIEPLSNGGYLIQGFKSRTSEETPYSEILPLDPARRAIELLRDRLKALKELGWVPADEVRLWLNGRYAREGRLQPYVGWGSALASFCRKHGLPKFSAEQLRTEVLAAHGVTSGGLEAARHVAGHTHLRTTAIYLDQLILQRLNSAYALEFERRLEASVRFRMGQDDEFDKSKDLLYPIGDGTSCADPHKPPDPAFLEHAVCSGNRCHDGDGCRNRRIVLDAERIEEIFRTQLFYEDNWRDLMNANREQFIAFHVPAMVVNRALVGIVEKSAHRHLAKKALKKINEDKQAGARPRQ